MTAARCGTCLWFDATHPALRLVTPIPGWTSIGYCRKHYPNVFAVDRVFWGTSPIMDTEALCGEYRKDEGK
jgi:hypothetical protein